MNEEKEIDRLLTKSKESFSLAVELYNRPTLKYHAESCVIFLCNAWELMLKAYLIRERGMESIYYDENRKRTLSLADCLKVIFTNEKAPLRINMRELIEFRNTSTHYITDEYEIFYGPFLQAAVSNYAEKLMDLHGQSVSDLMPENHLVLSIKRGMIEPDTIRTKYDPSVAEHLLQKQVQTAEVVGSEGDAKVAAIYETAFRIVKRPEDADINVRIDKNAETGVVVVKDIKDHASYYPYTARKLISAVNKMLQRRGVRYFYYKKERKEKFNSYHLDLFIKVYLLKGNSDYTHDRKVAGEKASSWTYSQKTVDFIVEQIVKDPEHCIDTLVRKLNERKGSEKINN